MVKLNKIYTRTGDDGTTGLVDGSRRAKHDPRMDAIGEVDELNSALGFAALAVDGATLANLRRIQNDLFDLGADLATPGGGATPMQLQQNKMMFARIKYQALAIIVVALLMLFNR